MTKLYRSKCALIVMEELGVGGVGTVLRKLCGALESKGWLLKRHVVRGSAGSISALIQAALRSNVIIASNNFRPAYVSVLLGLVMRVPVVVWVHGPVGEVLDQAGAGRFKRRLLATFYRAADALVFVSESSFSSFKAIFPHIDIQRCSVIKNPAPTYVRNDELIDDVASTVIELGFVGRLSTEKRPSLLLEMLAQLPDCFRMNIVGDGPMREELEVRSKILGLMSRYDGPDRVTFMGSVPATSLVYQRWQATLLCSVYEGYPMAALESLAAGVPCVSTPIPAMREMLGLHAPDWLSSNEEPSSLAAAVRRTLSQPAQVRMAMAHSIAARHSEAIFSDLWGTTIGELVCTGQEPSQIPKSVHFVQSGAAYMPEIDAYFSFLEGKGHKCFRHKSARSVPLNADVVWWVCGVVNPVHAWRLRRSVHVHEYASASVGKRAALKDQIKRWLNRNPDFLVFQSEAVRDLTGITVSTGYCYRDMGIPARFLDAQSSAPPIYDLIYLGETSRLLGFEPALNAIGAAGLKLLLVGSVSPQLRVVINHMPWVTCAGRVHQTEVPNLVHQARAGLNLMPNVRPYNAQTSTKVLEYLALGLPVISNRYEWLELFAASMEGSFFHWIEDVSKPASWTTATANLPQRATDRARFLPWTWPSLLADLPVWKATGLERGTCEASE